MVFLAVTVRIESGNNHPVPLPYQFPTEYLHCCPNSTTWTRWVLITYKENIHNDSVCCYRLKSIFLISAMFICPLRNEIMIWTDKAVTTANITLSINNLPMITAIAGLKNT